MRNNTTSQDRQISVNVGPIVDSKLTSSPNLQQSPDSGGLGYFQQRATNRLLIYYKISKEALIERSLTHQLARGVHSSAHRQPFFSL